MSAPSPWPWTIEPGTASNVLDAYGQYIAGVVCKFADGEPDTTDARLIEAAPELLAALHSLVDVPANVLDHEARVERYRAAAALIARIEAGK